MSNKKKPRTTPVFPRWFTDDRNQAIAEWLAHNYFIDTLVGREVSADVAPYSDFKKPVVEKFLQTLRDATAARACNTAAAAIAS